MALLFFEGFDNYIAGVTSVTYAGAVGASGSYVISLAGGHTLPAGQLGGLQLVLNGSSQWTLDTLAAQTAAIIWGVRFQATTINANQNVITVYDSAIATQCGVSINASGKLILWRNTTATVINTGATTFVAGTYYYIEIKLPIGNSVTYEIRVNGVVEISGSGADTQQTANANWRFIQTFPGNTGVGIDDIYLCDDTGSAPYNDFLGGLGGAFTGIRVETMFPTSDNSVQFTPSTGSNFGTVDEVAMNSDTDYNSDATNGHIDTFNHGSLSSNPTTIFGVKVVAFARKEDVQNRTLRTKLISGGTTSNGSSRLLTTSYQNQETYYNTNPDTGVAWANASAVNNTKIGYELVS